MNTEQYKKDLEAVREIGVALKYVKRQTEEICLEAVKQDGRAIKYVENQTLEICETAVRQNSKAIIYVKDEYVEACKAVIKESRKAVIELIFLNSSHRERWLEAINITETLDAQGNVADNFGASLYLLTVEQNLYNRLKKYVTKGCIDFKAIFANESFSYSESIIALIAGHFYNSVTYSVIITPMDILDCEDGNIVNIVAQSFVYRYYGMSINQRYTYLEGGSPANPT